MATIPSISLIPSGYKAGKVYSVLPTDGSGDLDFARTTTATRINKNGLIENVGNNLPRLDYEDGSCPSLLLEGSSTNLITQSEAFANNYWTKSGATIQGDASTAGSEEVVNGDFATDSNWTKGTGWTISGGKASASIPSGNSNFSQNGVLESGKFYTLTFTISDYVSGTIKPLFGGTSSSGDSVSTSGNGTYTYQNLSDGSTFYFRGVSFNGSIDNVSVKEVSGFSAPSADSPLSAFKMVEDTSTGNHRAKASSLTVTADIYNVSVFIKPNGRDEVRISLANYFGGGTDAYFNLDTKNIIYGSRAENGLIEEFADGWFRCSFSSKEVAIAGNNAFVYIDTSLSGSNSYTGDGTSGVYIFGAQVEQQSYATSYIPTAGSQISRTADTASKSGISSLINSTEGVFYVETKGFSNERTGSGYISLRRDGDAAFINSLMIQHRSDGTLRIYANGSVTDNIHFNEDIDFTQNHKIAVLYKLNGYKLFIDGVAKSLSGTPVQTVFSGLDNLSFSLVSSQNWQGAIKDTRVYKTALTDLEIEELSSWISFNAMALNFNYTIQ